MPTSLRYVESKTLEAESATALATAFDDWVSTLSEEQLLDWRFQVDGGTYTLLIFYTTG